MVLANQPYSRLLMAEYWKTEGEVSVLGTQFGQGGIPELRKRIGVVSSFISERIPESLIPRRNRPHREIQE